MKPGNAVKMRQTDIIRLVSELSGLSQKDCRNVIENYVHILRECVLAGREVCLPMFGTMTLKYKPAKPERYMPNVRKNGEISLVKARPAHNIPIFRPSAILRREMEERTWGNPYYIPDKYTEDDEEEQEGFDD